MDRQNDLKIILPNYILPFGCGQCRATILTSIILTAIVSRTEDPMLTFNGGRMEMLKSEYSRREFLRVMALGGAAFALPRHKFLQSEKYLPQIGIQLYTVRKALEQDFEATIKKVADMGFAGVETISFAEPITLQRAAKVIKDAGLKVLGCHCNLPVGDDREPVLKMAAAYGADRMVYHGWPPGEKFKNEEAIKRTVALYNEVAADLKTQGLKLGLHNHWWEFEKNEEGVYPFYYLLEHLSPDIFFEIDTYWAKTAGLDPVKVITDFGKRAPLLHIKDGPAQKGDSMYKHVPAGEGVVDFSGIAKAGGENIQWMIVEFDQYEHDIFDGVQKSYNYLAKNKLAKGKKEINK